MLGYPANRLGACYQRPGSSCPRGDRAPACLGEGHHSATAGTSALVDVPVITGTAYLYRDDLCGILEYFKTKKTTYLRAYGLEAVVTEDGQRPRNKWPVTEPYWCDPSELEKDHIMDNDKREDETNGLQTRRLQTRYINGFKVVLK